MVSRIADGRWSIFIEIFSWIEQTPVSVWVRESLWAFPLWLILHAIGMGFLAGGGIILGLRRAGIADLAPIAAFSGFGKLLWASFFLSLVSGLFLLAAYPAKAMTNPVFALKFICLGAGFLLLRLAVRTPEQVEPSWPARTLAVVGALGIIAAIFAGRFLAYTHKLLLVY